AIKVTWSGRTDATSYRVFRDGRRLTTITAARLLDSGLAPLTRYSYQVAACNSRGGCSALSSPVTARTPRFTLAAPSNVAATTSPTTHVTVSWTPSRGATTYTVLRNGVALPVQPSQPAYVDWRTSSGAAYTYAVIACDPVACSGASVAVAVTTPRATAAAACS